MPQRVRVTDANIVWDEQQTPPTVYANLIGIGMTPFDISVVFGEIGKATESEVQGVQRIKVSLVPELVPQLIAGLADALKAFTENNGALRGVAMPPLQHLASQLAAKGANEDNESES